MVFLDIELSRMNGYEVARPIRAAAGDRAPVLVAVTGYGQTEDRRRSEEAGFRHRFVKPVSPDSLYEVVARLGTRSERTSGR